MKSRVKKTSAPRPVRPPPVRKPLSVVRHSDLKRADSGGFKSVCPVCPVGMLLIFRVRPSLRLSRLDNCVACGHRFWYIDDSVGGESFEEPAEPVPA